MLRLMPILLLLAACGADGPPQPPGPAPGLAVTGEARMGVVLR